METKTFNNQVYIAASLDGFIAGKDGDLGWLETALPENPEKLDFGYEAFMETIDALMMGRNTFETVMGFDGEWPYAKPVFVWSTSLSEIPEQYQKKAFLVKGSVEEVLAQIHVQGYHSLYIDGGKTIQSFLQANAIDAITITLFPILLGEGTPLFGTLQQPLNWRLAENKTFLDGLVQVKYVRPD